MAEEGSLRLAVLIDADNAPPSKCAELLAEIARHGTPTIKRAYGDWTTNKLSGWKKHLHSHAIHPVQQFSYTVGKNATDSSLIIEAMDFLHEGRVDGFCIVSSDSDFTRLATRIREAGLFALGIGEQKTPEPFIAACDRFVYVEILGGPSDQHFVPDQITVDDFGDQEATVTLDEIMQPAVEALSKDDGWASLAAIGSYINKTHPSFDPRNYGYEKLGQLVKGIDWLEVDERRPNDGSGALNIYVCKKG